MDLKIYFQNVRGVKSKCVDIYNSVLSSDYDVICLCETWLDDTVFHRNCLMIDIVYLGEIEMHLSKINLIKVMVVEY